MDAKTKNSVFIHIPELKQLSYPEDCPFKSDRALKTYDLLSQYDLLSMPNVQIKRPRIANRLLLKKFHSAIYLHTLRKSPGRYWDNSAYDMGLGTQDSPAFKGMYLIGALAAGGSILGANILLEDKADVVFNPAGGFHHAHTEKAGGFSYINDAVLACMTLAQAGKKVAYLDIDAHHGGGVQNAFYNRSDIMTISMHESGRTLFPGTGFEDEIGIGPGNGYNVNIPMPVGTFDAAWLYGYRQIALPLIKKFDPDVLVLQLGADALASDPLTHLQLTNNAYINLVLSIAQLKKPILALGGGGYNVPATVNTWGLLWATMAGLAPGNLDSVDPSSIWQHQDRPLPVTRQQQETVLPTIKHTIKQLKKKIFSIHDLSVDI